jgi:hypothetical protein
VRLGEALLGLLPHAQVLRLLRLRLRERERVLPGVDLSQLRTHGHHRHLLGDLLQIGLGIESWLAIAALFGFCVVFPLWFFRTSRLLWSAFDLFWDPPVEKDFAVRDEEEP